MENDPFYFMVGNIKTPGGTKHFVEGAKLYCFPVFWGDGGEYIYVMGRHRGKGLKTSRYTIIVMQSKHIHNWRCKEIHSPTVMKLLKENQGMGWKCKENIEEWAEGRNA